MCVHHDTVTAQSLGREVTRVTSGPVTPGRDAVATGGAATSSCRALRPGALPLAVVDSDSGMSADSESLNPRMREYRAQPLADGL
jgi:hypothetical protein